VYPPEPALRCIIDMFEWCSENTPKYNPISISGYHIREAGATAAEELALSAPDIGPKAPGPMAGVISPVLMNSAAGLERALQAAGMADRQLLRETLRANGLHDFEPEADPDLTQRIVGRAQVGPQ
jgi:hypothetical protein